MSANALREVQSILNVVACTHYCHEDFRTSNLFDVKGKVGEICASFRFFHYSLTEVRWLTTRRLQPWLLEEGPALAL